MRRSRKTRCQFQNILNPRSRESSAPPDYAILDPDPVRLPLLLLVEHVQEGTQLSVGEPEGCICICLFVFVSCSPEEGGHLLAYLPSPAPVHQVQLGDVLMGPSPGGGGSSGRLLSPDPDQERTLLLPHQPPLSSLVHQVQTKVSRVGVYLGESG